MVSLFTERQRLLTCFTGCPGTAMPIAGGTDMYSLTTLDRTTSHSPVTGSNLTSIFRAAPDVKNTGCSSVATNLPIPVSPINQTWF